MSAQRLLKQDLDSDDPGEHIGVLPQGIKEK